METISALLVICEGDSRVTGGFHSQIPNDAKAWWCIDRDISVQSLGPQNMIVETDWVNN